MPTPTSGTKIATQTDIGFAWVDGNPVEVKYAVISATGSGDTVVIAAVTGKRILVLNYVVVALLAVAIKFRSNTTDITGAMNFAANGGAGPEAERGHFRTAVGEALNINLSLATAVGGHLSYVEV